MEGFDSRLSIVQIPGGTRPFDEVNATEELGKTRAGNPIKDIEPPLFTGKESDPFHQG